MPTKYPPAWSLDQAIKAIKAIHEVHSKDQFNAELLGEFLDTTKTSSYFGRRISALQTFGLLNKTGETAQLTDLAIQIVKPVAGEDQEAKLTAFRKVDVLANLLPRYPNTKLPDPDTLKSVLLKSIGVDRDTIGYWYTFVVDSFKAISGISSHVQPVEAVSQHEAPPTVAPSTGEKTSIVYLPSGRYFKYSVQEGYSTEDMEFVLNLLNLFKSSLILKDTKKGKDEGKAK